MVTRFEDIPDELFLLICRHLTWLEVMNVFYLLNIYLPSNLTYVQFKEYRDKWLPMLKPHTLHIQESIHYPLLHPLFGKILNKSKDKTHLNLLMFQKNVYHHSIHLSCGQSVLI